jgi:predicted amidohydrolase
MSKFKIAGVQMDIKIADATHNLDAMEKHLLATTRNGVQLTVFPECTITGYCFESLEEAIEVAEPIDGPSISRMTQLCEQHSTRVIFGFLELDNDASEPRVFNSLAYLGPQGLLGTYRKVHLPFLGIDRFTTPGDRQFDVVESPEINIGMNICYDCSFPEGSRVLAIQGADLIALPTNWPPTSGLTADIIPNARALENHVYFMSVNRIGSERGFEFIGKSKICDPGGNNLAFANHANEEILYAEIDVAFAREKHRVAIPGKHEVHRMKDRRPDIYGPIADH